MDAGEAEAKRRPEQPAAIQERICVRISADLLLALVELHNLDADAAERRAHLITGCLRGFPDSFGAD